MVAATCVRGIDAYDVVGIDKTAPHDIGQLGVAGIGWEWHIVEGVASKRANAAQP